MALLVILALLGAAYTLFTSAPTPIRQVELLTVWATLALIAIAVLGTVDPAISLVLTGLVIAPLWFLTLRMNDEYARERASDTAALWHEWRANFDNRGGDRFKKPGNETAPLSVQIQKLELGNVAEENELTQVAANQAPTLQLELVPTEARVCLRGRNI